MSTPWALYLRDGAALLGRGRPELWSPARLPTSPPPPNRPAGEGKGTVGWAKRGGVRGGLGRGDHRHGRSDRGQWRGGYVSM